MHYKYNNLKKKGWTNREIEKTFTILKKHDQSTPKIKKSMEKSIFWILLFMIVLTNFIIGYAMLPLFIFLNSKIGLIIVVLIAVFFGAFISQIIKNVEKRLHHHIILLIMIPISAFINILIMTIFATQIANTFDIMTINPVATSIIYSVSFLIPYFVYFYNEIFNIQKKE